MRIRAIVVAVGPVGASVAVAGHGFLLQLALGRHRWILRRVPR